MQNFTEIHSSIQFTYVIGKENSVFSNHSQSKINVDLKTSFRLT